MLSAVAAGFLVVSKDVAALVDRILSWHISAGAAVVVIGLLDFEQLDAG